MNVHLTITNPKEGKFGQTFIAPSHTSRITLYLDRAINPKLGCGSVQLRLSPEQTEVFDLTEGDEITLRITDILMQEPQQS